MAPATSRVFIADQMIGLMKEIDGNVQLIVREAKKQGPRVQKEVRVLLHKYLDLLSKVLGECRDLKRFTETSQRSLKDIEEILTLVVNGKVKEILEEISMEHYLPNFEDNDLTNAYQLLKDNFDIDGQLQAKLKLTDDAKDAIQDRVRDLRNDFSTIGERLKEVKEKAGKCCTSSKITENFNAFMKEIEETQKTMTSTTFQLTFPVIVVAIALLCIGVAGFAACASGCKAVAIAGIYISAKVPGAAGLGGGAVAAAAGVYDFYLRKEDMDKIHPALENLEGQLNQMCFDADKQKTAHKVEVQDRAKSIVDKINDLNADNLQLEPSRKGPMKRLLPGVQSVRTEVTDLEDNVEKFQTEATRTLHELQDLSLMKESDAASTTTERPTTPLVQLILDFTEGLGEALVTSKIGFACGQYLAQWLKGLPVK